MKFDGRALLDLRTKKGLTQEELAAACGTTFSTISRLERSAQGEPTLGTVQKIADALGVDPTELLILNRSGDAAA